jgi:hypothetical protein
MATLFTLAMQHGMLWVSQGLMPANTKAAKRNDTNYLVSYAAPLRSRRRTPARPTWPQGDLETARCSASAWPRLQRGCAADSLAAIFRTLRATAKDEHGSAASHRTPQGPWRRFHRAPPAAGGALPLGGPVRLL